MIEVKQITTDQMPSNFNTIGEPKILQVGVKIIILNKECKGLLLKRNQEKYPGIKNLWDLPGGRIELGKGLKENLQREVLEETGMVLLPCISLLDAQDIIVKDKHIVRLTYVGSAHGELVLSEEHVDYGWFTLNEMASMENLDIFFSKLLSEKREEICRLSAESRFKDKKGW